MTIALTGATGFVGKAVLDEAVRREEPLRALTRRTQGPRTHVEWIEGDLANPAALASMCHQADAVIHVAGLGQKFRLEGTSQPVIRRSGQRLIKNRQSLSWPVQILKECSEVQK